MGGVTGNTALYSLRSTSSMNSLLKHSVNDGMIRDLNICISNENQVEPIYRRMMEKNIPDTSLASTD